MAENQPSPARARARTRPGTSLADGSDFSFIIARMKVHSGADDAQVTCLIVTYNSSAVLARCLDSIDPACPVLVVDNASSDDSVAVVASRRPAARVIRNPTNLGYGPAANVGIRAADTPLVFLINPDVALLPDTLPRLAAAAATRPEHAIYGPRVEDAAGQIENRPLPALFAPGHPLYRPLFAHRSPTTEITAETPLPVGWISGCAMLLRVPLLQRTGLFDERIFLFYEETDLCLRAVRHAVAPLYVPDAVVRHFVATSTATRTPAEQQRLRYRRLWYKEWSRAYLADKYRPEAGRLWPWYYRQRFATKIWLHTLLGHADRAFEYRARLDGARGYRRGERHPSTIGP